MRDLYRGDGGPLSSYDEGWNDGVEAALAAIGSGPSAISDETVRVPRDRGDPMENWLMKPALEWLEEAEHGAEQGRCKMIAEMLRDFWRNNDTMGAFPVALAASQEGK